jgi:hypothetical protein
MQKMQYLYQVFLIAWLEYFTVYMIAWLEYFTVHSQKLKYFTEETEANET